MDKFSRQDAASKGRIKIADLARLSGVSKSGIHHYLNIGLLHPPRKLGLSLSVFDWTHLDKLKRIRELREGQKLPLSAIREVLSKEDTLPASASREIQAESLISVLAEERGMTKARKSKMKRVEIINAAISLFSKNGYENTTIEAIAESLHMAKSTVYLYFESKEDLFMACIGRLTVVAVPEEAWAEIREEQNALRRLKKRGLAFHKAFPSYRGILIMAKAALGGDNQKLAEKAKDTLSLMTRPIVEDLQKGMADGLFRKIDEEIVAHAILATGEGLGCRLMMDSRYTIEEAVDAMFDLFSQGMLKDGLSKVSKVEPASPSGDVTDLKGVRTRVGNIRFGNSTCLPVKIGEAEVRLHPDKVERVRFQQQGSSFGAEIVGKDGQTERGEVDGSLTLSGEVPLGEFAIELRNVAGVLFHTVEPQGS